MAPSMPFQLSPPNSNFLYAGFYSPAWVIVSVFLATFGCFAALRASTRIVNLSNFGSKLYWRLISGTTMGIGIWAMHFIGMLAFNLPCRVEYNPIITLISIIPGILASNFAVGLGLNSKERFRPAMGSVLIGTGAATMHYMGMVAMQLPGYIRYDPALVILSVIVVISISYLALSVSESQILPRGYQRDLVVAVILGTGLTAMHYIGMSSAYFIHGDTSDLPAPTLTTNTLALIITLTTVFLALGTLILAAMSRSREIADQLRDSVSRVQMLLSEKETTLSNALVGIAHIKKRRVVSCNRRFEEIFQYDPGELIGQSTTLFYESIDIYEEIGVAAYENSVSDDNSSTLELRMRHKDGSLFHGMLNGKAINRDNPTEGSIWICLDISERKHAEEELRIAAIAFDSQNATVITDADYNIIRVNRPFTLSTGYSSEEIVGRTPRVLYSNHHHDNFYRIVEDNIRLIGSWNGEIWHQRRNGEVYPVLANISAVKSSNGITTHFVATYTDISDSVRMRELEKANISTEQRLNFALDAAQIGEWSMDLRTNVAVRSLQHDRCFGYTEPVADWGYDTFLLHVDPTDRERVDSVYKRALSGKGDYDVEFRVKWPDQSEHWLWSKGCFYFDQDGVPCRVAGIQVEITARRQLEQKLLDLNTTLDARVKGRTLELELMNKQLTCTIQQLEKTQHALVQSEKLASLGSMVAGVAHELNTPLGNALLILTTHEARLSEIQNCLVAGTLSRKNFEEFFSEATSMINLASKAVSTAAKLVESFKQVARDQSSEQRRQFNLADVITEIINSLKLRFINAPWIFDLKVSSNILMDSYPGALEQILINLVLNSIGHGFEGRNFGTVTISGLVDSNPSFVIISVDDDGIGIAPENVDRVFDPFFTTKLGRGGSGIGLNVSQRLATKILCGELGVFSVLGEGSNFILKVPLSAPENI